MDSLILDRLQNKFLTLKSILILNSESAQNNKSLVLLLLQ